MPNPFNQSQFEDQARERLAQKTQPPMNTTPNGFTIPGTRTAGLRQRLKEALQENYDLKREIKELKAKIAPPAPKPPHNSTSTPRCPICHTFLKADGSCKRCANNADV